MYRKFFLLRINITLASLLFVVISDAQDQGYGRPLRIGNIVPDIEFTGLIGYPSASVKLSDFRDKLVILDFWATWCTACVQAFPKMEELQEQFRESMQVIALTREDSLKAASFLAKYAEKKGSKFSIPSVTNSTVHELFPHRTIPHYVWIDGAGVVIATTDSKAVTADNIQAILDREAVDMPMKQDLMEFDAQSPLFIDGNGGDGTSTIYRSLLSGPINGLTRSTAIIDDRNPKKISHIRSINSTIIELYSLVYDEAASYPDNRIILEVENPAKLRWYAKSGRTFDEWQQSNTYCYELIAKPAFAPEIRQQVLQDLDRYFGLTMHFEKRMLDCWVLVAGEGLNGSQTNGGESMHNLFEDGATEKYLTNESVATLLYYLNMDSPLPFVDETGYKGNFDLRLPGDLTNVMALQKTLHDQGLQLTKAKREVEVLVITDEVLQ